ncbi:uncharacterized protein A4U43_C01F34930 [Asparagus officinalis]|uniref:Piwi domain-containing protein n=1 Tax=Asparagus officinalis TaxID=4686 RepID=A0A5P1FUF6_ASPOF|nr:uncharacterized protein A4U43_C01F34930 [Asparagus officinalis]
MAFPRRRRDGRPPRTRRRWPAVRRDFSRGGPRREVGAADDARPWRGARASAVRPPPAFGSLNAPQIALSRALRRLRDGSFTCDSHKTSARRLGIRGSGRQASNRVLALRRLPASGGAALAAVVIRGEAAPAASWVWDGGDEVAITPKVTSKAVCRKIISELVKIYKDSHLERRTPAYDGMKSLYTAGALPFTSQQFKIKLAEKDRGDKEFDVTIKCAGHADLHHLDQLLHGRQFDALDIVLRESPSQKYVTIARSFFSKDLGATEDIGGGLECWRGYYQKLRPTQMGLSLNIGTAATPFYHSIPVIDFAKEYLNIGDAQRTLTEKQRIALTKALRGIRVGVTHRDTSRRYKINGLSNEPLAQLILLVDIVRFPVDDKGNKKLVVQYFQEKYNCKLVNLTWPCLQSGSGSNPTHLPMEVCKIVEGQRFLQKLEEKQVTEILRATCQRPHEREESIRKIVMENNYEDDEYAQEFGIKVAKQLTSVEARVLLPPKLQYHNTGVDKTWNPKGGAWSMFNKVVASMDWPEVTKYKALISSQPPRKEIIEDLYTTTQGGHGGMIRDLLRSFNSATGHEPQRIIFYRDGVSETQFSQVLLHEVDAIKKACQSLREGYRPGVTFVVVQKRHHTRLFPETHGSEQTDGRRNILPVSLVLIDYSYARCTRSVSLVPPVYYAHLAAFRARYYFEGGADIRSIPHVKDNVKEVMFYC